ncbi:MAG: hypothetical protein JO262_11165 [Solirubrobacterales bacterium]|nr:hypothetical protein [Solirubrobacterales bacterium]MBV9942677.1 hypothetical protein [Solirubrobacterales bacterium]
MSAIGLGGLALSAPMLLRSVAINAPTLRAALEMMMTLFAIAAAWLLRAQFASSRRLRDLLLLAATLVLGLINFAVAALPAALDLRHGAYFAAAQLWGRLFVGAMFALAACVPSRSLVSGRGRPVALTLGLSLVGLSVVALGGFSGGRRRPSNSLAVMGGHPMLVALVVLATALLAYAAIGFVQRQRTEKGDVAALQALAMMLLAGGSLASLLAGSLAEGRISAAEVLSALSFGLILATAIIQERQVHARLSKATALAERRRIARDLHDGIAQDLAFIAAHGHRFVEELGDDHPVVVAAKRALALSRSTISELSDPDGATTHEALEAVAQELRERFGISIAVNCQLDRDLAAHEREHVTRIAREAIANAARHGRARNVIVSLRQSDTRIALRVVDDGCGIAGVDLVPGPEGFGLRSMRERAAALGGQLRVHQPRRGGTELEVVLP